MAPLPGRGAGNEFVHDPNPSPYDNTPDFYDQPPPPQYELYLCELYGNDSHFGYDCPPRFPLVYDCGGPHESFQCQQMNQNYFEPNPIYNSSYSGFDQPPQYSINHQKDLNQQRISDVHNGWDKIDELQNEFFQMIQSFCEKFLQQKQAASIDQSPLQEMSLQEIEDLKQHYLDKMLSLSNDLGIKDYRNEKIDIRFRKQCENMIDELKGIERISKSRVLEDLCSQSPGVVELHPDGDSVFDLPSEDIECKDSYDSNLDESTFLVTPLFDSNEDVFFAPSDDVELLLHRDPSTPLISVVSILEGFADEPPLEENDDLFELESKKNDWEEILYDDPIDDLIFDPGGDDEIDAFLDIGIPMNIKDGLYDSEGDVLYLESLLTDDTTPSPPPEVFLDRDPRIFNDIND
ncbi:hypothetical protein Tco_0462296 [Tanacetum coccineum]